MGNVANGADTYASGTQLSYAATKAAKSLREGDEDKHSVNNDGAKDSHSIKDSDIIIRLEAETNKQENILQRTQKHPKDTPDGKEKIDDAERNLDVAKATLESTTRLSPGLLNISNMVHLTWQLRRQRLQPSTMR